MVSPKLKIKDSGVTIDKRHVYTRESDGTKMTGMTTITGNVDKPFLSYWYAKEAIIAVNDNLAEIVELHTNGDKQKLEALLETCKKAAPTKANTAKEAGSLAHKWIENYIGVRIQNPNARKFEDVKPLPPELIFPDNEESMNAIKAFIAWENDHEVEWLASELIVASVLDEETDRKLNIAGTLDAFAIVDGECTIVDFKTSKQISPEYYLQTMGYKMLLSEMIEDEAMHPTTRIILRLPKDGTNYQHVLVDTDEDFDRETLLKLRDVHRWLVNWENNVKERVNPQIKQWKK